MNVAPSEHPIRAGIVGALTIAAHLLAPFARRWRTSWGATPAELERSYVGDALLAAPHWQYTHAITVDVPPARVWPWIVQIGQGRAGFYSYEWLEHLVGCEVDNLDAIVPQLQQLAVGDAIHLHPELPPLRVHSIEAGHTLLLVAGGEGEAGPLSTWLFCIEATGDGRSRLITRGRGARGGTLGERLANGPTLLEPVSFVMEKKMLERIKALAEAAAENAAPAAAGQSAQA